MSATKDSKELSKKPTDEVKRILQNDQEKQRKEKIKTCIGEIAKELPPSADHVDRKPSTLSIVSQAKEYIKKLKEQNNAYENNLAAEQQQEELKRLREAQAAQLEKIRLLEETVKAYAVEKILKSKSSDDNTSVASDERENPQGRRRPKTINKLLEKERNEMLQAPHSEVAPMEGAVSLLSSGFNSHSFNNGCSSGMGSNTNSSLPPSSMVVPVPSSGISIMTVAPTILSVKSPSLGQSRNNQTSRSISTASVAGSSSSNRINTSSLSSLSQVSYLDIMGNDFTGTSGDGAHTTLVYSTSSAVPSSSSVLATGSGPGIHNADLINMQQLQNNGNGGTNNNTSSTSGGSNVVGNLQPSDLSMLQQHQQQGVASIMNLNQQTELPGSATALQTLASVATSSHMAALPGVSLANNQNVNTPGAIVGLPVTPGSGMSSISVSQMQQQQPTPVMSQADTGSGLTQGCKQVIFNGQILTLTDQGLVSSQQHGETDCQTNLQANSLCQQANLALGPGPNLQQPQQQGNMGASGILGHNNFPGATLGTGGLGSTCPNQPIIFTINDQGQLVPLQSPSNPIQPSSSGLDFASVSAAGGNIISNFQNTAPGGSGLMPSSLQHQPQSNFLTQQPIVSLAGGHGGNHPFTILPPTSGNPLQPHVIPSSHLLMAQQLSQQQQVLNLGGLGGLQIVSPFPGMMVNNMGTALNGSAVKIVGNELKIVQPGESSSPAQGPTHVMVDGSLIPISTNPQTIVPNTAPLSSLGQKSQQLPLGGNPILQFDPNNPSAPPILINGPATTFQMAPPMLGPGPLQSPALTGGPPGILHMAPGASLGSSTPFQLGTNGGLVMASTMVSGTVTTNAVTACISSPAVSTSSKGGKSLPPLAPALSQTSPSLGSTVTSSSGFHTILPSGLPQQFIISGQKVVSAKLNPTSAPSSKSSQSRKRSPSAARASPVIAAEVPPHFVQNQQNSASTAAATVIPLPSPKLVSGNEKSKSKSSKNSSVQQRQLQQESKGNANSMILKTDLLAQATATAGISMETEGSAPEFPSQSNTEVGSGNLNVSTGSNESGAELQINLKQSPRDEEDDNVQLIIDENCVNAVSSTSPAHSSFSPNIALGTALTVNTSSPVFNHDIGLGSSSTQHKPLHLQTSSGVLSTPLMSPNLPSSVTLSQQKVTSNSAITTLPTPQLLSPLPSNIFTPSTPTSMGGAKTSSDMQIVAGPFRPEDVFAQLSGALSASGKMSISPESGNKLNPLTVATGGGNNATSVTSPGSSSLSLTMPSTTMSPGLKSYVPIAPAPVKVSTISTALTFGHEPQTLTFADAMGHAALIPEKPAPKGKSRSRKSTAVPPTVATMQCAAKTEVVSETTEAKPSTETKKKPPAKKRKTKAELKQEKERLAREEEERKKKETEEMEKAKALEEKEKGQDSGAVDEDCLLPILEMNENDAVKEQILHSVSESKLLNTDGSQISLMDMVDKIEFSSVEEPEVFTRESSSTAVPIEAEDKPVTLKTKTDVLEDKTQGTQVEKGETKTVPRKESSRKRKGDAGGSTAPKADNKRTKKSSKTTDLPKQTNGSGASDIYDFVDDEDSTLSFHQPPPTPVKSPTKKTTNARKGKAGKNASTTADNAVVSEPKATPSSGITTRSEARNSAPNKITNSANPLVDQRQQSLSAPFSPPPISSTKVSTPSSTAVSTGLSSTSSSSTSLSLTSSSELATPKSPLMFSSVSTKSSPITPPSTSSTAIRVTETVNAVSNPTTSDSNVSLVNSDAVTSCMSKKEGSDVALHSTLEESFSMDFPVMDFQSSPKLSESQEDADNSMGLPADTLADFLNQHSPKMILNSSPPTLPNGVLSPSDVDLPALRTPAPPMNHNQSEPELMLGGQTDKELISPPTPNKHSLSRMHTPPPLDAKSPVSSLVDSMSTPSLAPSGPSLSLPSSSSPPVPTLTSSLPSSSGSSVKPSSCMDSSTALHHLDPSSSTTSSNVALDSQMPSLSSASLDALSEILPLKPITSELEGEDEANNSCAQQQRRPPLSLVPLNNMDMGMGLSQPNPQQPPQSQQQASHADIQKSQQQQQQRSNQPHLPPQSSPHNLRPPSASTTPLPSPKLHASPGSASNASSVHSMSPAAQQQQQQQHHSCQKQQAQNAQMGNNPMMDRVGAPPLSHPPQQSPNLSQLFPPPDTSPRNATFASPPSGSNMKLKHMSPSSAQTTPEQQNQNYINSQKGGSFPPGTTQQQKNQYSVDKIIEHPNSNNTSVASRHPNESFNFTNIGSNVTTASPIPSSGTMPLTSNNSTSGFSFSLSSTSSQRPQQASCSANVNSNNSSNSSSGKHGSASSMQPSHNQSGTHNSPYLNPFFPPPPPMNLPSSSSSSSASSSHHNLAMHPLGNMEIQHQSSRPSSGGSSAPTYGMGPSSLMTFGNQPKLDIPPIAKSPTYNNGPSNNSSNNNNNTNSNVNTGKSQTAASGGGGNYSNAPNKQTMDSSNSSRYQASKSTPESIYQQQQKRPNTIQHPPAGMNHMDPMARLSSSAHNNSFFPMGFPTSAPSSLSSASMPLRHLPDTRDMPSRSPYDYPPVHHPAMGFPHPHSQIPSGYGTHPSFGRDCSRLDSAAHHHQQQQQQAQQAQQQQQPQQSPRKQTAPKKTSSNSVGGSNNSSSNSSNSNNSSHRSSNNSDSSSGNNLNQGHGHSPATSSSSRAQTSQHHSNHQQNNQSAPNSSSSSSSTSTSHNRSSNSNTQKRKAASSSSSSKKKNTASQHTGFPTEAMDAGMSQGMFETSFSYLNFPTLTQSMSPPAARPHQADTPFLGGMFNATPRPISNTGGKAADMAPSHFPLFHSRAQNSFFQPGGFSMNSMTGNHGNPAAAGIAPHSMAVPSHMSAFGLFGNEPAPTPDSISSNKFLHANSILPGAPHQTMDHSLQHGAHQTAASLYHGRPHSAQSHMMAFYQHGFDSRGHMGQPFNGSMGPPPFHSSGLPAINFSMHDSH